MNHAGLPAMQCGAAGASSCSCIAGLRVPEHVSCVCAQMMYNALLENNCSEQASRMSAMESSTKNATEMLSKLTLTYNRCSPWPGACAWWLSMPRQPGPLQQATVLLRAWNTSGLTCPHCMHNRHLKLSPLSVTLWVRRLRH